MSGQCLPALRVVPDVTKGSPRSFWPGPSPRPCGARAARPPGAKAPGQRPTCPKAGASHPPGRALAFVMRADRVLQSRGRRGRGKAMPFLIRPARPALSQGRNHFPGKGMAGSVFCSLPRLQAFLKQPFAIPPSIRPRPLRHQPPISAQCSPSATTPTPAACGRAALNCRDAPARSVTNAPARSAISTPAAMSHSQESCSVSIPSNRPSTTK